MKISRMISHWRYPETSERSLERQLEQATADAIKLMQSRMKSIRFDADEDDIHEEQESVEDEVIAIFLAVAALLPKIAKTVYLFSSKQWLLVAISSGGADNPAVMDLNQFGAKERESWYKAKRDLWVANSQNSIVKLARDITSDWSANLRTQALKDAGQEQAAEVIAGRYAVYGSWSKNRAAGIIGSFSSMLMMQRLKDAGVSKYIWRGKMDDRERPSHVKLEGKSRELTAFPFPGEEYGCRCWAVPDWETNNNGSE